MSDGVESPRTEEATAAPAAPSVAPITPEIENEIRSFEEEVGRFERGEISPERFRSFRLIFGVYGQRQPGVQMIRVKIPAGGLNARHLSLLGTIARTYGHGLAHVTTRQDVQFHFVPLARVPALMRELARAGLTTREACGNSVRNVTCCPVSGMLAEERFDVTPYAHAASRYLIRNPFCQLLPRKFKIAFSGCPEDCTATGIHDIGMRARVVEGEGRPRAGFAVAVGGGLGTTPYLARPLAAFVPIEEMLPLIRAILVVFARHGNRRNKNRARLKFVVESLGIEAFREEVLASLAAFSEGERAEAALPDHVREEDRIRVRADLDGDLGPPLAAGSDIDVPGAAADLGRWIARNTRPHRDPSLALVTVELPLGDIEGERLEGLGALVARYGRDHVRTTIGQNLVLPEVNRGCLPLLFSELASLGLAGPDVGTARDIVSCPGADTCNLGITSSKGVARALREELARLAEERGQEILHGIGIKVSGCPNACGQHYIGQIGLHGVAKKVDGQVLPHYQIHLGGRSGDGALSLGEPMHKVPARKTPAAVRALIEAFADGRTPGEPFPQWVARTPLDALDRILAPYVAIDGETLGDLIDRDWGAEDPFTTDGIGAGECAGGGPEIHLDPFGGFLADVSQVKRFLDRGQAADAAAGLYRSLYALARILLEALGKKPDSDWEVLHELRAHVIDRGHASDRFNETLAVVRRLLETKAPAPADVRAALEQTADLLKEARRAQPRLKVLARSASRGGESPG